MRATKEKYLLPALHGGNGLNFEDLNVLNNADGQSRAERRGPQCFGQLQTGRRDSGWPWDRNEGEETTILGTLELEQDCSKN